MEFFRKAFIGISVGLIMLALTFVGIFHLQETTRAQSLTVDFPEKIQIESRKTADNSLLLSPYETVEVFLSEEQDPGFEFTSVGGSWEEYAPLGTNIEAEVRFKVAGEWTEWLEIEEEEDLMDPAKTYGMASSNPATAMQYKYLLYGDGTQTPLVESIDWTFINSAKKISVNKPVAPKYSNSTVISTSTNLALNLSSSTPGLITRAGWGADPNYLYKDGNDADEVITSLSDEYYQKFAAELTFSKVIESDSSGREYKWPLQYPTKVKKFVIHHTATTGNLSNPAQAIRDIYYYHAFSRGWGDIGYNYIIDRNGKIYEGRHGGEGVIGAHSGAGNNGSIGIAVLGNYEQNPVPQKVVAALSSLISQKAQMHRVDPDGFSNFRGELMKNIFGHRDIAATTCPGAYLYEKLETIRSLAAQNQSTAPTKEKFVIDYDYIDQTDLPFIDLAPNEERSVTMRFENIGKVNWNSDTYIVVLQDPNLENLVIFPTRDRYILSKMNETTVRPGEIATFTFTIISRTGGGGAEMQIAPVVNGSKKIDDYRILPVAVTQSDYRYEFVSSILPPSQMESSEAFKASIKLKNTGNITWNRDGANVVRLGTDHVRDRLSDFLAVPKSRIGFLIEAQVKPGEIGTFTMDLRAPDQAGFYKEYFTPVVEGITWMADSGTHFATTVFSGQYGAEIFEMSTRTKWEQGSRQNVWIKIRNLGDTAWTREGFSMDILHEYDLGIEEKPLLEENVPPGGFGTLQFITTVDPNEDLETKPVMVYPKVNGIKLTRRPMYYYYTVVRGNSQNIQTQEAQVVKGSGTEGDIRVKLGFAGNPVITANTSFNINSGNNLLTSMSTGETATVRMEGSKYVVIANSQTYAQLNPIRFVPQNGGIMEIKNFENHPAWKPELNDNQFRGILEVNQEGTAPIVINELPLENYMKGLAESSNGEYPDKIRAIIVAARSYAKFYMDQDEKFPGKPYHLDDNPDVSQKYLGYGLEKRSPNVTLAVDRTRGQFVTYKGKIVKAPYFSQSDGKRTKNASDVWAWSEPYLVSVSDTYCNSSSFLGHGVGMSGCGASGMAKAGFNYLDILKHYYTGIEITDLY